MCETPQPEDLLTWYDRHARIMPWRVSPEDRKSGHRPDPYRVWLSEIMLQQTTVAAVRSYFLKFTELWPTVSDLARAEDDDVMAAWAGLGYYARARNLLKCARVVTERYNGIFPSDRAALQSLPGIGPYTSAAIASIAFDQPETVVDGNVERVMARVFAVEEPLPPAKARLTTLAESLTPKKRPGDYAQAVMDLGATICTPKRPACGICPWMTGCKARDLGIAADLPRKLAKAAKPTRKGVVYVARRSDGAWLLERRPDKGLLGGMLGWPGSDWSDAPTASAPISADWTTLDAEVRHTFTHFHLILTIQTAWVAVEENPSNGQYIPHRDFRPTDLPTVFRKVFDVASHVFLND
ncbi:A/G-specific adenine glycosylase [Litoreibacter roseus]|uniref:Adenine DNA glycosylase n=1 Tax=Litoreibacter roseus TaxID=2601869 RepID=A0A6N6JJK6_9RHOB|nr:A/G-specific adenine glycosylase [Litoreibacter roseus]GFE66245.1 A/G-specific adenine glycosylase [Litoreibacter roseus]